jgi:2-aminoethylphosphonate-pyruvate transaminase
MPQTGRLLVPINGAYGARLANVAEKLGIAVVRVVLPEHLPISEEAFAAALAEAAGDGLGGVTHVALVHCETTTGTLNDVEVG